MIFICCQVNKYAKMREGYVLTNPGRPKQRETYIVLGKYLDDALLLAHMSKAELARRAKMKPAIVTLVCQGKRTVGRDTLLLWCDILLCPDWLEERILNVAGFASRKQVTQFDSELEAEQTHQRVLEELRQKEDKRD